MKPEFSKPFDLAAARAGAPFACYDGCMAEILKYADTALFGTITNEDGQEFAASWRPDGNKSSGVLSEQKSLVMTPLGLIAGKPVFVGDELVETKHKMVEVVRPHWAKDTDWSEWSWPAPAKAYPETALTDEDFLTIINELQGAGGTLNELRAVANAALKRAVDAGQIVAAEESAEAVRKAYADGQAIAFKHEAGGRAARDMVVARAMRDVCIAKVERYGVGAAHDLFEIQLESIIQSVQ